MGSRYISMELQKLVDILLEVKAKYPTLSNIEILELIKLKTLMEIKVSLNR